MVHSKIAYLTERAFREIEGVGDFKLDYGPGDTDDEWGYASRPIRGSRRPSNHSWGLAVDLNAQDWPMGQSRNNPPQWLVDIMATHGFSWGGKWSRPDPMHFEWMGTPSDADKLARALLLHDKAMQDGTAPAPAAPAVPAGPPKPAAIRRWMSGVLIPFASNLPDLNPSVTGQNLHIVRLQQVLNVLIDAGLAEDGLYNQQTIDAVVRFQRFFKVPMDTTLADGDFPGAFGRFSRWYAVHVLKDINAGK